MKKGKYFKLIAFDIIYVAAMTAISWIIIFCVDFLRISNKCDPVLCIPVSCKKITEASAENASAQYWGIGYKIYKYNSFSENSYKIMPW